MRSPLPHRHQAVMIAGEAAVTSLTVDIGSILATMIAENQAPMIILPSVHAVPADVSGHRRRHRARPNRSGQTTILRMYLKMTTRILWILEAPPPLVGQGRGLHRGSRTDETQRMLGESAMSGANGPFPSSRNREVRGGMRGGMSGKLSGNFLSICMIYSRCRSLSNKREEWMGNAGHRLAQGFS